MRKQKKKVKIRWDRVALLLLALHLITGCARLAIKSWIDPEHHAACVIAEICSTND